jgi:hypothetical protein
MKYHLRCVGSSSLSQRSVVFASFPIALALALVSPVACSRQLSDPLLDTARRDGGVAADGKPTPDARCLDHCTADAGDGNCPTGFALCQSTGVCVPSGDITAEICDGKDNDCNGMIDDGVQALPCVPACAGVQTCTGAGGLSSSSCAAGSVACCGPNGITCPSPTGGSTTCAAGSCNPVCTKSGQIVINNACVCPADTTECDGQCVPFPQTLCTRNTTGSETGVAAGDFCALRRSPELITDCSAETENEAGAGALSAKCLAFPGFTRTLVWDLRIFNGNPTSTEHRRNFFCCGDCMKRTAQGLCEGFLSVACEP